MAACRSVSQTGEAAVSREMKNVVSMAVQRSAIRALFFRTEGAGIRIILAITINDDCPGVRKADVRDKGVFNRLSADWAATDQLHVLVGYDLFYAEGGMFARYAHNSEAWLKLKYNF